jgi:hypothetical protein
VTGSGVPVVGFLRELTAGSHVAQVTANNAANARPDHNQPTAAG